MPEPSPVLHPDAARAIRDAVREAHGNEVFFVGRPGADHAVAEVQVVARGHESAVPAVVRDVRPGEVLIHNHPSGVLQPSEADLDIAGRWGAMGVGFVIVDNEASDAYTVVEPHAATESVRIGRAPIDAVFEPGGVLSRSLAGYEQRHEQQEMARLVGQGFDDEGLVLTEAGTGTGKSLAYLVPAILFAVENRERVVVSTNTINLQEQLIGKDLPFLREHLGVEFKSVLLKGRSNYLCRRKTEFASRESESLFDAADREVLTSVVEWAAKSVDGSRSDLSFMVPDDVWAEVASDADDCMRVRSPYYSSCFFFASRREAASADVIVVNHHLLMADLALRAATGDYTTTAVLPPYQRVILDEAHNLEDVASSYFGSSLTGGGLLRSLGRLESDRRHGRGVLRALEKNLPAESPARDLLDEALAARKRLAETVRERLQIIAESTLGYLGVDDPGRDELRLRLRAEVIEHPAFREGVAAPCRELGRALAGFAALLHRLRRAAADDAETPEVGSALSRVEAVRQRLDAASSVLGGFCHLDEEACHWLEVKKARRGDLLTRLATAPLEVGELLARQVYDRMKSVVATSATLTVGKSFDHFSSRLGLDRADPDRLVRARFESPFDFVRQALVLVPTDMPEPNAPDFTPAVCDAVEEAVDVSRGRALILFTSYGMLMRAHRALGQRLARKGLTLLRQGEDQRDRLLGRLRNEEGVVLFAVDSFWEGIDVPGDALSLVVLVRLPFRVPTEPLQEARVEALEKAGRDPFREFTVPQAVIKFRQGFGRLIRSRSDRGIVMILDPRVVRKSYGRLFLDSLPDVPIVAEPRQATLAAMRRFFAAEQGGA